MECPRCHNQIVQGVLFCPDCEVPLKIFLEEANPMGTTVWEYGKTETTGGGSERSKRARSREPEGKIQSVPLRRKP